ncbi:MAG: hypothetical protein OXN86_03610 [Chloroflexota bacterium]|nr:hypothetical protein [Chloroflexota bacterium]MDE2891578.1 hypothetical protein [Chloroflexota bacterium]
MSRPSVTDRRPRPPDPAAGQTDALWQYLRRIEHGLDQIDARIDRLYIALGGGTVLLAAIGLGSAFIVRGG